MLGVVVVVVVVVHTFKHDVVRLVAELHLSTKFHVCQSCSYEMWNIYGWHKNQGRQDWMPCTHRTHKKNVRVVLTSMCGYLSCRTRGPFTVAT